MSQTKIVYRKKEEDNKNKAPFLIALEKKKFYKAMDFYEDAEEEKHPLYQKALLGYFKKDVVFGTANGKILSNIYNADNFTIGDISLSNFHVSGGLSLGGTINGLLGMNFLGRYKFKIDQKDAILFLAKKY